MIFYTPAIWLDRFGCATRYDVPSLWVRIFFGSWKMKVLKKGCVRKLAVKRDPFYKLIAGGSRPLVTQRCLEMCQSQENSVWNTSSPNHWHSSRKDVASLESFAVLPHLANFRNSCKNEGLIASQKRSFATCEFLANFEFRNIFKRKLRKSFKNGPKTGEFFFTHHQLMK